MSNIFPVEFPLSSSNTLFLLRGAIAPAVPIAFSPVTMVHAPACHCCKVTAGFRYDLHGVDGIRVKLKNFYCRNKKQKISKVFIYFYNHNHRKVFSIAIE